MKAKKVENFGGLPTAFFGAQSYLGQSIRGNGQVPAEQCHPDGNCWITAGEGVRGNRAIAANQRRSSNRPNTYTNEIWKDRLGWFAAVR